MANNSGSEEASKSLNKTITEIMTYLKDSGGRPRDDLRPFVHEKLADLSEKWFKRGFNRGHRESWDRFSDKGKVPRTLRYEGARELFSNKKRKVELKSMIKD
jgi:hypothetical protein